MATPPPAVEDALYFLRAYVPNTIVDNWRVVGTTAVMIGLCLCPIIGSAWEANGEKAALGYDAHAVSFSEEDDDEDEDA